MTAGDRENVMDIAKMRDAIRTLVRERDWEKFHTPKNIAMAMAGEVGELCELFQWLNEEQAINLCKDPVKSEELSDELADIFYYTLRLCDVMSINLDDAFWKKLNKTRKKYPVELAKGNATKYTDFKR